MAGRVITYVGEGEGKTMSAVGHAVRALGNGERVLVIHFMKGRDNVGEYKVLKSLDNIEIHLCGAEEFFKDGKNREKHEKKVREGMEIAKGAVAGRKFDLIILDEVLYAIKFGLLEENELTDLLEAGDKTSFVITGREPGERIKRMSDIITQMVKIKHHYDKDKKTDIGVDY